MIILNNRKFSSCFSKKKTISIQYFVNLKIRRKKKQKSAWTSNYCSYFCEQQTTKIIYTMNCHTNKEYTIDNEQLARFAKAMGHPARITILQFLASMDSCYFGDINKELPIAKATVSQHLKELKDAGLIQGEIETPKVKYCINPENWKKAQAYFEVFFELKTEKTSCCPAP